MQKVSQGDLAVVTGAAGGLGSTFAKHLAARGYRLLLVDRRQNHLEQVCQSITTQYDTPAEALSVDLCNREEVVRLAKRLEQTAKVGLLVNNAGFGTIDYFIDTNARYVADMVDVHVVAPTILTRAVLPGMIARDRGAIINVSSLAAWFQSAGNVHYGSTKCYLAVFSLSLREELRGTNVQVQALCPGFIRTEFHAAESMQGFNLRCAPAAHLWMSPEEVVSCSLRRLSGKQVVVIPGVGYRVLGRLAQMPVLQPLMRWITRVPRGAPHVTVSGGPYLPPVVAPEIFPSQEAAPAASPLATPAFVVAEVPEGATAS